MKILVIGGGGREHALVWKLSQSPLVKKIYCIPGNGGISLKAECPELKVTDIKGLVQFAQKEKIDLTIVGPEIPLMLGTVDRFRNKGLKICGPTRRAAILEGSKSFAKRLTREAGIPVSSYRIFRSFLRANEYLRGKVLPIVIKADGLAGGKGVIVCHSREEAKNAVERFMIKKELGKSGEKVIIEDYLPGEELSYLVFTDGRQIVPMASAQDHKRIYDGEKGPNTGGMGAYSPYPFISQEEEDTIINLIIRPAIDTMGKNERPYQGILYAGLMMLDRKPYLLEFNVRCGDPETQPIILRLKSDLLPMLLGIAEGKLPTEKIEWDQRPACCVVVSSQGYPGDYKIGYEIKGLKEAEEKEDVVIFHAGTKRENGRFYTNGGRVLGVTALGNNIKEAIDKAYDAVLSIDFKGAYYRKDIGHRALEASNPL